MTQPERMIYAAAWALASFNGQPFPADCAAQAVLEFRKERIAGRTKPYRLLDPKRRLTALTMRREFLRGE